MVRSRKILKFNYLITTSFFDSKDKPDWKIIASRKKYEFTLKGPRER